MRIRLLAMVALVVAATAGVPALAMPGADYRARGEAVETLTETVWGARLEFWGTVQLYRVVLIDPMTGVEVRLPDVYGRETYTEYVFEDEEWCGGQVWTYRNHGYDKATQGGIFEVDGLRKYCLGGPGGFQGDLVGHYGQDILLHFTQFP